MGTRGLIIIKHNKQIKVSQYYQFDMYYDGHGKHIAEILQKMLNDNVYDHFKQLVSNLKFVDDDYLQEKYQGKVATQFLRNTASDIFPLIIQGVQASKEIAIVNKKDGKKYSGHDARQVLGLPLQEAKMKPGDFGDWRIFIQSTSYTRKIKPGNSIFVIER